MGTVIMHDVVSVDGYIAYNDDMVGPLHDFYFSGDVPVVVGATQEKADYDHSGDGGGFRMSAASAEYVRAMWQSIGCLVIGRHFFDLMNGWEGNPPVGDHVIVVSHRPKPEGWHPDAPYTFVDDIHGAIRLAQEIAGDRVVTVNAGNVGGQIFAAGLIDEVAMDVVPVIFGSGKRYFGDFTDEHRLEDPHIVVPGERVLHTRYKVSRDRAGESG
ncbi:dihydrofolate reductase family protein [Arthrobacter woluwensis]|uniref:dihydrofolate reductase family protein n=1 Tax=Arthrobacter woluwensis TaxID=156980 RepID=UPI0037FB36B2